MTARDRAISTAVTVFDFDAPITRSQTSTVTDAQLVVSEVAHGAATWRTVPLHVFSSLRWVVVSIVLSMIQMMMPVPDKALGLEVHCYFKEFAWTQWWVLSYAAWCVCIMDSVAPVCRKFYLTTLSCASLMNVLYFGVHTLVTGTSLLNYPMGQIAFLDWKFFYNVTWVPAAVVVLMWPLGGILGRGREFEEAFLETSGDAFGEEELGGDPYYAMVQESPNEPKQEPKIVVYQSWYKQLVYGVGILLLWLFVANITYTAAFKAAGTDSQTLFTIYIMYIIGMQVGKTLGKQLAIRADGYKSGTFSLYFSQTLGFNIFYAVFYRGLFDSLDSWGMFFLLQAIHAVMTWMEYAVITTDLFWKTFGVVSSKTRNCVMNWVESWVKMALFPPGAKTQRELQAYAATDLGLQSSSLVVTALGQLATALFIQYNTYNAGWYQHTRTAKTDFSLTMAYLGIAVGFEVLNTALINLICFQPRELSVLMSSEGLLKQRGFQTYATFTAAICLMSNIYTMHSLLDEWTDSVGEPGRYTC